MKSKTTTMLAAVAIVMGLLVFGSVTRAQQPTASPAPKKAPEAKTDSSAVVEAGEDAGDYTIISSLEVGYRLSPLGEAFLRASKSE